MNNEVILPFEIQRCGHAAIALHRAQQPHTWFDNRGLQGGLFDRDNLGYDDGFMPVSIDGLSRPKTLLETICDKVETSSNRISIIDLGCGPQAAFLNDCNRAWPNKLNLTGVNSVFEPNALPDHHIHTADVQSIDHIVPPKSADIITCVFTIHYTLDPYHLLRSINMILKPNGIAFVNYIPLSPVIPECQNNPAKQKCFIDYLRNKLHMNPDIYQVDSYGKPMTMFNAVWKRQPPSRFLFPIKTTENFLTHHYALPKNQDYPITTLEYKLLSTKPDTLE